VKPNHPLMKKIMHRFRREKAIRDAVFDSIPGIIYLLDEQGNVVQWNRCFNEMTGYSDAEIGRMHCLDFFRGADVDLIVRRFETTMREGVSEAEADFYRKDGSHFPVYLTSVRLMIDDRPHVAGIGIDVSERNHALEELARSEEELRRHKAELERTVELRTAELQERAEAQDKIVRKNELLRTLADTTETLLGELDLSAVLQQILDKAIAYTGLPHGFVQLFEPESNVGAIRAGVGVYAAQVGTAAKVEGGVYAEVIRTGKLVVVEDYANWPGRLTTARQAGLSRGLQAPLKINDKFIGLIGLAAFGEPGSIDEDKLTVVEHLAGIASIAIKNALSHDEARTLAYQDVLTGLANRVSLNRWLETEMQRTRYEQAHGALFFIDMDDLKTINDTFGHSLGDEVIVTAARHIQDAVGKDGFLARIGGDEFVVGLPGNSDRLAVSILAERLLQYLSHDYEISGQHIHMSASIGITLYPKDGDTPDEILKNADSAMYAAKRSGRNCWSFYEPVLQTEAFEKMTLTNSLRRALDREELLLHFQPTIRLPDRRIVGFEALLRWNSPEHGPVAPGRFIPYAEQSGIIIPLGYWVVIEACRFAQKLCERGRDDICVAVNISSRQLADVNFIAMVRSAIHESGIRPAQLEIEVTESVLIESIEESIKKLVALKEIGVKIALDDFGTGYSSLTYLRRLPVGTLKVDKSFIDDILADRTQADLVGYIIDMAHTLNLSVVAEGVESEAQLEKLHQYDCDHIQGYVFSRPLPAEEALRLLE